MNKNPSLNHNQSVKSGYYYPKPISTASTDKWIEYIRSFMVNKPDLDTLKLRPAKYQ
jgi:hypothetical protein